jgi:hypothetical protein
MEFRYTFTACRSHRRRSPLRITDCCPNGRPKRPKADALQASCLMIFARFCDPPSFIFDDFSMTKFAAENRKEPQRTSKEPGTQPKTLRPRTRICNPHKPPTANKRTPRNGTSQNGGAAVSRRMTSSIRSGPVGARGVFNSKIAFPNLLYIYYISFFPRIYPIRRIL